MSRLEHLNVTVANPRATAQKLIDLFGWRIRWEGPGMTTGHTIHVGDESSYVALFSYGDAQPPRDDSYRARGGLNHIGVVVDDLDAVERTAREMGYTPHNHADYEPGRRFYFDQEDGIEIEVVSYR